MRSGKHDPLAAGIGFDFPLLFPGIAEFVSGSKRRTGASTLK
jgi:hypothetical protein